MWDLLYYLALKLLLDWPPSLFTWDILFLIPVAWTGPVLAPLVVSLTLIGLGLLVGRLDRKYAMVHIGAAAWALMGLGAFVIFLAFIRDYSRIIIEGGISCRLRASPAGPGASRPRSHRMSLVTFPGQPLRSVKRYCWPARWPFTEGPRGTQASSEGRIDKDAPEVIIAR